MVELRSTKHPHEVWLLGATLFSSLASFVFFEQSASSTARSLPQPWGQILFLGLGLWSLVSLVGVFWRKSLTIGAIIERAGLFCLSIYGITYAIIILGFNGARGITFAALMVGLGIANLVRVRQIGQEIKELQAARTILKEGEE